MKNPLILSAIVLSASLTSISAQTIAQWTFETSPPADLANSAMIGGIGADVGTGTASGLHASALADWSTPAGNGSANSLSANEWAVGDYFQFSLGTVGYSGIGVSFDQTSSSTGPRDFSLQYSTDGSSFTTFGNYVVLQNGGAPNASWNGTTYQSVYTFAFDLSAVSAINNSPNVYFRLVDMSTVSANGGTVATTGTDRVDNFTVYVVPEPTALTLGAIGFGLLVAGQRLFRRN